MRRNFVRFKQPGYDRRQNRPLRSPEPDNQPPDGYQQPEEHQLVETYQPPEEYHRILSQFRSRRNASPELQLDFEEYRERHPETEELRLHPGLDDDPFVDATRTMADGVAALDDRALQAEYRRYFPNAQDTISPFRAPEVDHDMESPAASTDSSDSDEHDVFDHYLGVDSDAQIRDLSEEWEAITLRLEIVKLTHQNLLDEYKMITRDGYHKTSVTFANRKIWILRQMLHILDEGVQAWEALMELRQNEMGRHVLRDELTRSQANASYARLANHRDVLYDHCVEAGRYYVKAIWSREFGPGVQVEGMPATQSVLATMIERVIGLHHNVAENLAL